MTIAEILGLLIGVVLIATIADRLRVAYPILLVIAGLVVAILPFAHRVQLEPDLILLVFLPPLIYDASLDTSARELRTHWRPILLLAVGLVLTYKASGVFNLAFQAGVPVVPVALVGMRELLPMGSVHLRSGDVVLRVGDPISTIGMEASDRMELTGRLYREVARLLG